MLTQFTVFFHRAKPNRFFKLIFVTHISCTVHIYAVLYVCFVFVLFYLILFYVFYSPLVVSCVCCQLVLDITLYFFNNIICMFVLLCVRDV